MIFAVTLFLEILAYGIAVTWFSTITPHVRGTPPLPAEQHMFLFALTVLLIGIFVGSSARLITFPEHGISFYILSRIIGVFPLRYLPQGNDQSVSNLFDGLLLIMIVFWTSLVWLSWSAAMRKKKAA